jgi:hypothetical protein
LPEHTSLKRKDEWKDGQKSVHKNKQQKCPENYFFIGEQGLTFANSKASLAIANHALFRCSD